jgi:tetratricopeptide (TPR) repeat protein
VRLAPAASADKASNAMASASLRQDGRPSPDDVRAQIERMTASDIFTSSPQLASFLVFIVDALLRGQAERLKGYTIGVEVLRRDVTFDPQIDPIVRVEATRLRRAIGRYYAGPGADDPIQIDLPRGGYVPRISSRVERAVTPPPPEPERIVLAPGNGLPTLRVAPFVVHGTADTRVIAADTLVAKISEAFALFDTVNVTMAAPPNARSGPLAVAAPSTPAARSDYRLDGAVDYRGNESVDLRFKLVDEADATVIWSRAFEKLSVDNGTLERHILLELCNALVQPFGVIWANDRAKRLAARELDPRYAAVIETADALRSFDPEAHARARERLERLVEIDPNFGGGIILLAALHGREYVAGREPRPNDPPPLDRALKFARRGVELAPQNSRAFHVLFTILFLRGEKDAAIAAAERALALNPYDVLAMAEFGGRLIYCGEIDRGLEILNESVGLSPVLPAWSHFALFVGHYMRAALGQEDLGQARYHASQLTSETYVYGQLARALIAHADGDRADAQRAVQAILALAPAWGTDPRREIGKLINANAIAERLAGDLVATGYIPKGKA